MTAAATSSTAPTHSRAALDCAAHTGNIPRATR
jgi:hypothetical protein